MGYWPERATGLIVKKFHTTCKHKCQNTSTNECYMYIWTCITSNDPESLCICTYRRQKFRSCLDELFGCFVVNCLGCIIHHSIVTHQVEIILQWDHNIVKFSSVSGNFLAGNVSPILNINGSSSMPSVKITQPSITVFISKEFITCRAKLLNADWLRQRAFSLNQEGMITWCWLAEHACIKLVSRFKRILKRNFRNASLLSLIVTRPFHLKGGEP